MYWYMLAGMLYTSMCYVRRIWAHRISFFVPRVRDTAHPGSGSVQDSLRLTCYYSGEVLFSARYAVVHAQIAV